MIAVFDSGYGGLTILRALVEKLPQYDYLYLGDNAHAPYGDRPAEEIYDFTREGVTYLFEQGSVLVVLACNTASAVALRQLQQEWLPSHYPDRRILGILVPTIEQITGVSWQQTSPTTTPISPDLFTVGVLATPATVTSGAYPHEIQKRNRSIRVVQEACPGLVEAIELNQPKQVTRLIKQHIQHLMSSAQALRAVLLGCTHYELVTPEIAALLPSDVRLYHQPTIVAASLANYLGRHPELARRLARGRQRHFFTTGDPTAVSALAARYFGQKVEFSDVKKSLQ